MKRIAKKFRHEVARYNGEDEWFHGGMNHFALSLGVTSDGVHLTLVEGDAVRAVWSNLEGDFAKKFKKALERAAQEGSR